MDVVLVLALTFIENCREIVTLALQADDAEPFEYLHATTQVYRIHECRIEFYAAELPWNGDRRVEDDGVEDCFYGVIQYFRFLILAQDRVSYYLL